MFPQDGRTGVSRIFGLVGTSFVPVKLGAGIMNQIEHHLQARVGDAITIGAVVFSYQHNIILKTSAADILISRIMEE